MKKLIIIFLLAISSAGFSAETNEIVYLGELALPIIRQDWIGRKVTDILGKAAISQFLVIRSESSAPLDMHTRTIKKWLKEDLVIQDPKIEKPMYSFFDAILILEDGRRYRVRMNGSWLCLTSPTGSGYIFTGEEESSNNRLDRTGDPQTVPPSGQP